jgi:CDP-glucose 4,6-dehydratase
VENLVVDKEFWLGKRVLVTGHTGFKGGWLVLLLHELGAEVHGLALEDAPPFGIYAQGRISNLLISEHFVDICDLKTTQKIFKEVQPEIVFHLAAESLVGRSYGDPYQTFLTNVMGTLNVIKSCQELRFKVALVVVTSDKCYENQELGRPFAETDSMGGFDPYSASKGCAEIVSRSMAHALSEKEELRIVTARSGNVFGGGDWNEGRLIPDLFRALRAENSLLLRHPDSIRPWQFVLDPLKGYLMLAKYAFEVKGHKFGAFNFGPRITDQINVLELATLFKLRIPSLNFRVDVDAAGTFHEQGILRLNSEKAFNYLGWRPKLTMEQSVNLTCEWYIALMHEQSLLGGIISKQVSEYLDMKYDAT